MEPCLKKKKKKSMGTVRSKWEISKRIGEWPMAHLPHTNGLDVFRLLCRPVTSLGSASSSLQHWLTWSLNYLYFPITIGWVAFSTHTKVIRGWQHCQGINGLWFIEGWLTVYPFMPLSRAASTMRASTTFLEAAKALHLLRSQVWFVGPGKYLKCLI